MDPDNLAGQAGLMLGTTDPMLFEEGAAMTMPFGGAGDNSPNFFGMADDSPMHAAHGLGTLSGLNSLEAGMMDEDLMNGLMASQPSIPFASDSFGAGGTGSFEMQIAAAAPSSVHQSDLPGLPQPCLADVAPTVVLAEAPAPDLSQQASAYCMSLFNSALNNSGYAQLIANENRTQQYFTVFAIPDAHMETVCKLQFWQDERKRREFIGAHLVRGKVTRSDLSRASSSSITTLGPHVQSMTVSAPSDDSFQVELGGVKVVQSDLPFGENTVHILEAPFVVLSFVGELRREQVWNKVIQPHPEIQVFGSCEVSDEVHAMLTDYGSPQVINKGVKGEVVRLSDKVSLGGTSAKFDSLVIMEKAEVRRKRKTAQEVDGDGEGGDKPKQLVFSLYRRRPGNYLTTIRIQNKIAVKNSFHTLSTDEKEFRRLAYEERKNTTAAGKMSSAAGKAAAAGGAGSGGGGGGKEAHGLQLPPVLLELSTSVGTAEGGNVVWLQGQNFSASSQVFFGHVPAAEVQVVSPDLIKLKTPAFEVAGGMMDMSMGSSVEVKVIRWGEQQHKLNAAAAAASGQLNGSGAGGGGGGAGNYLSGAGNVGAGFGAAGSSAEAGFAGGGGFADGGAPFSAAAGSGSVSGGDPAGGAGLNMSMFPGAAGAFGGAGAGMSTMQGAMGVTLIAPTVHAPPIHTGTGIRLPFEPHSARRIECMSNMLMFTYISGTHTPSQGPPASPASGMMGGGGEASGSGGGGSMATGNNGCDGMETDGGGDTKRPHLDASAAADSFPSPLAAPLGAIPRPAAGLAGLLPASSLSPRSQMHSLGQEVSSFNFGNLNAVEPKNMSDVRQATLFEIGQFDRSVLNPMQPQNCTDQRQELFSDIGRFRVEQLRQAQLAAGQAQPISHEFHRRSSVLTDINRYNQSALRTAPEPFNAAQARQEMLLNVARMAAQQNAAAAGAGAGAGVAPGMRNMSESRQVLFQQIREFARRRELSRRGINLPDNFNGVSFSF